MSRGIERVEDMPVYQLSYALALEVEKRSQKYPRDFLWLRIQKLRSSESVCANMGEGFYAQYSTEYRQSLRRCYREARETQIHIRYATDVGLLESVAGQSMIDRYEDAMRQMNNLMASIERKIAVYGKGKSSGERMTEEDIEYETTPSPLTILHSPSTINH